MLEVAILKTLVRLINKTKLVIKTSIFGKHTSPLAAGKNNLKDRNAWLKKTLLEIPNGSHILDAGAGELKYKDFCKHLVYTSQDFGKYDGAGDGSGLQAEIWDNSKLDIVSDIMEIPKENESFDTVMCIEVLEHLPDPIRALKELARLIKPGGNLIITAPFASLTHFSPYYYHTGFSRNFYEYWSAEFGLKILDLKLNGNYFEYMAQELNRVASVAEKYTSQKIRAFETEAIQTILETLTRLSSHDSGSNELLSFGVHFFAEKL